MNKPHASVLVADNQTGRDIANAVVQVLNTTFGVNVHLQQSLVGKGSVQFDGDMSGIVGIIQEKLEGTLTVCFPQATIKRLVPLLLGDGIEVTQDVAIDAVGEVTNMIFGQLKTELNGRGFRVRFSLPSVVKGSGSFISHLHEGGYMMLVFDLEGSRFQIHLAIHGDAA